MALLKSHGSECFARRLSRFSCWRGRVLCQVCQVWVPRPAAVLNVWGAWHLCWLQPPGRMPSRCCGFQESTVTPGCRCHVGGVPLQLKVQVPCDVSSRPRHPSRLKSRGGHDWCCAHSTSSVAAGNFHPGNCWRPAGSVPIIFSELPLLSRPSLTVLLFLR